MVVCDLSSGNPNVLYELGIRHSFDLPVVLLKDDITDFIFDVAGIKTIQYSNERLYENVLKTRKELTDAIKAAEEAEKKGTVLRIMQINKAIYSNETVTTDEKNELLLNQVLNEIQKISNFTNRQDLRPRPIVRREHLLKQYHTLKNILNREPSIHELQEITNYPAMMIERFLQDNVTNDNNLYINNTNEKDNED